MKIRTFAIISLLLLGLTSQLMAQVSMLPTANLMTNQQAWDSLSAIDANGNTMFGKCKVVDATACPTCACDYYFRASIPGTVGQFGWPKNPSSGDSTGCLGKGCWSGYTPPMCTADIKANAKAILLDALANNACGTLVPPTNTGGVSVLDSSQFFFVNPNESCANGEAVCGVTGLGSSVGDQVQFTKMSKKFCTAALGVAQKKKDNSVKMISCATYAQKSLSNSEIQNAAKMLSVLNVSYSVFELVGMQKYLDYSSADYQGMSTPEVALYYVAVGKNSLKLPNDLKPRVIADNFNSVRGVSDRWIIQSEITAAEGQLALIAQGTITGHNFNLEEALAHIKSASGGN